MSQALDNISSNNTNKLSPQEPFILPYLESIVQIIQINLVLKNAGASMITVLPFK